MATKDIKDFTKYPSLSDDDYLLGTKTSMGGTDAGILVGALRKQVAADAAPVIKNGYWWSNGVNTGLLATGKTPVFRKTAKGLEYKYEGEDDAAYVLLIPMADLSFTFADLTPDQVLQLKLKFSDLTEADKLALRGKDFTYADFTTAQLDALRLTYDKLTPAQKADIKGERGYSAYEVWTQQPGNTGKTYAQYEAELQKPATDAAKTVTDKMAQIVTETDAIKTGLTAFGKTAKEDEVKRVTAETARVTAEAERATKEAERIKQAAAVATAETARANKETERNTTFVNKIKETDEAIVKTNTAAAGADTAKQAADTAAGLANTAATNADTATGKANTAAANANANAVKAGEAAVLADDKAGKAQVTIIRLEELEKSLVAAAKMKPTGMTVECPKIITFGNTLPQLIKVSLAPAGYSNNTLFLGDDKAVSVAPDGTFTVKEVGVSKVHVIPTENTSLYQTVSIQVVQAGLRKVSATSLRLTKQGIRLD